jgi:hypothetical protein
MFRKKHIDFELTEKTNLFWFELEKQCSELNSLEFEYYYEKWGFMWNPWFIEVGNESLSFSVYGISSEDLNILVEKGKIEIVKIYDTLEIEDKFDRKRYRIIKTPTNNGSSH